MNRLVKLTIALVSILFASPLFSHTAHYLLQKDLYQITALIFMTVFFTFRICFYSYRDVRYKLLESRMN